MATNPIISSHLTFAELVAHWQCSENDLRDAIVSQRLVPSIYVNGAVWVLDASGKRIDGAPAIFVNEMMYLVGVSRLGAADCAFNFYARQPNVLQASSLFKDASSGYVDSRKRMADVEQEGRFMAAEIARSKAFFSTLTASVSATQVSSAAGPWWTTDYKVVDIAEGIKKEWIEQGRGVNQSGRRAGQYSRTAIAEAVAKKIEDAEKVDKTNRPIGGKSIDIYLKKCGWK